MLQGTSIFSTFAKLRNLIRMEKLWWNKRFFQIEGLFWQEKLLISESLIQKTLRMAQGGGRTWEAKIRIQRSIKGRTPSARTIYPMSCAVRE
jgi:hypothetical protein